MQVDEGEISYEFPSPTIEDIPVYVSNDPLQRQSILGCKRKLDDTDIINANRLPINKKLEVNESRIILQAENFESIFFCDVLVITNENDIPITLRDAAFIYKRPVEIIDEDDDFITNLLQIDGEKISEVVFNVDLEIVEFFLEKKNSFRSFFRKPCPCTPISKIYG